MILSDRDIIAARRRGEITIRPFVRAHVQPASVDLRLDKHFKVFVVNEHYVIDPRRPATDLMRDVTITPSRPFILHPGEFALGLIYEETGVSAGYVGRLEGKSSLGRLGLIIHTTAGYLDPGNTLKMTLELFNAGRLPIKLYYKMPIAQMAFERLSSPCARPYGSPGLGSKYYRDTTVQPSKMHENFAPRTRRRTAKS